MSTKHKPGHHSRRGGFPLGLAALGLLLAVVGPASAQAPASAPGNGSPPSAETAPAPAPERDDQKLRPSTICLGPFTPHEMELYGALAGARERLVAAEAALAIRERLLDAREIRIAMQLEEVVRLERRMDAKLAAFREEDSKPEEPPSPEALALRQQRAAQLSQMVQSMQEQAAAKLLGELPAGLATEVLSTLPARKAGKVLSAMDPEAASALSISFIHTRDQRGRGGQ